MEGTLYGEGAVRATGGNKRKKMAT